MIDYTPYRIMGYLVTVVEDSDDTILCYPHGKIKGHHGRTGSVAIAYDPQVIDAPTPEEKELFDFLAASGKVVAIPQDKRGFDARDSGVARSIDSSRRGRERGIRENMSREAFKAKRKTSKAVDESTDDETAGEVTKEENGE